MTRLVYCWHSEDATQKVLWKMSCLTSAAMGSIRYRGPCSCIKGTLICPLMICFWRLVAVWERYGGLNSFERGEMAHGGRQYTCLVLRIA